MVYLPTDAENMVKAQRSQSAKCHKPRKERGAKGREGAAEKDGKEAKIELKERKKKKDKVEPLQQRGRALGLGDGESLDCCVLLTRLEEKKVMAKVRDALKAGKQKRDDEGKTELERRRSSQRRAAAAPRKTPAVNHRALRPKTNQCDALLKTPAPAFEPRRRRMASLNAEAVNSLLLYRDESLSHLHSRKQQPSDEGLASGGLAKAERGHGSKKAPAAAKERTKKSKRSAAEPQDIDWLALFAPTPRRQAGLTAATLLRLTSATYGTKRQKKTAPKPAAATGESTAAGGATCLKREDQPKHKRQDQESVLAQSGAATAATAAPQGCCSLCKGDTLKPDWTGEERLKEVLRRGSSSSATSSLGFPLKTVKEEPVEAEVSSCYCCSQESCVKYCHRMALFLEIGRAHV